jgi:CheY-like chemotaxis protein
LALKKESIDFSMSSKRKSYRVLVVEDNPGDYVLIQNYLEGHNYNQYKTIHTKTYQQTKSLLGDQKESIDALE